MKLPSLALALLVALGIHSHAAVSPVHMDIEQRSSTKPAGAKSGAAVTVTKRGQSSQGEKTQRRSLAIKLSNHSSELVDGLVVKYFFLGHDMKDHKIKVLKAGERKSSLAPRGSDTVESEDIANDYTEAHGEVSKGKGKGKGGKSGVKKIPASGQKITGYAVRVMHGTTVEAESYSEPSYKQIAAEYAPSISDAPQPAAKKKTPPKKKK